MSSSFNKTILMGHLTRDWEMRYTPKGAAVASNDIAVNRTWQTESGEKREDVAFIPLTAWGRNAENLGQYTHKGDPLLLEGRITQETWEDKNTQQKRSRLKVVVETFSFIKGKDSSDRATAPPSNSPRQPTAREQARSQASAAPDDAPPDDDENQVPF